MTERADPPPSAARSGGALRHFGRFQLMRLIGKSQRTMLWLAIDPSGGQEVMLGMPRAQLLVASLAERWRQAVRRAMRLQHPHLAVPAEVGEVDHWPFIVYDRHDTVTLAEKLATQGEDPLEMAHWSSQALAGLAFAHDAGVVHGDIQAFLCGITDQGAFRWLGLELAAVADPPGAPAYVAGLETRHPNLQSLRGAAERDVLGFGLLMHQALCGQAPLGEADLTQAIGRLPPLGRDIVRLPWKLPRPIPDPLRAIVNRATDRQERQRYRSARTLQRALEGWQQSEAAQGGGPLALLLDRLRSVGVLPALPGAAERAARIALMERERTNDLAEVVLQDPALSFELLRAVNSADVRGGQLGGGSAVLTVRRAIALMGMDGVRRCALSLRAWPGPLAPAAAEDLARLITHCKRVGTIARHIRPAGYDEEVVYLVALLQNLGRLVVQYHFPDEATQIERLMQSAPSAETQKEEPGMSAEAASFAVLGVDIEAIGAAVARQMGFDDDLQQMIRRIPEDGSVHPGGGDAEVLRATASCANEIGDALLLGTSGKGSNRRQEALVRVVQRYARVLAIGMEDVIAAVQAARNPGATAAAAAAADTPPARHNDLDEAAAKAA
jgi:eukaryotic-like serine/threonine-protein kinase